MGACGIAAAWQSKTIRYTQHQKELSCATKTLTVARADKVGQLKTLKSVRTFSVSVTTGWLDTGGVTASKPGDSMKWEMGDAFMTHYNKHHVTRTYAESL